MMPVEVYWKNPKRGMSSRELFGSKWVPLEILVSAFVEDRPQVDIPPSALGENRDNVNTPEEVAAGEFSRNNFTIQH